jgi:hypothetical protein
LLEQCPGEPLCDSCLAFACSVSLTEMRIVTAAVANETPFARAASTCASCRRQTTTLAWGTSNGTSNGQSADAPVDKCTHCSRPIDPSEDVEVIDTDRFHMRCWRLLTTEQTIRVSRALNQQSRDKIRRSRELMGLTPPEETAEA